MESFLHKLTPKHHFSTGATIFLMFTYTILLDRDLTCTCKQQHLECPSYMVLPFLIIVILTLWTSRSFLGVCRYTCTFCGSEGCSFLFSSSPKVIGALSVGLLWVVFVLIDGDWFVCCLNDGSDGELLLGCKSAEHITESEHVKISELKNRSRFFGGFLLLGIVSVGFLMKLLVQIKCCRNSTICNRKYQYYKLILREERGVLKKVLRKSARDQLTEEILVRIHGERWEDCFDVAEELIKKSTRPEASRGEAAEELGMSPEDMQLEEQGSLEEREELSI